MNLKGNQPQGIRQVPESAEFNLAGNFNSTDEATFVIEGPKKQLLIKAKIHPESLLVMMDTIVNRDETTANQAPNNTGETKQLYLKAVIICLEFALENRVNFQWLFVPTDPQQKMRRWASAHLDTGEEGELKTFITTDGIPHELARLKSMLNPELQEAFEIRIIQNSAEHELELRQKIQRMRQRR